MFVSVAQNMMINHHGMLHIKSLIYTNPVQIKFRRHWNDPREFQSLRACSNSTAAAQNTTTLWGFLCVYIIHQCVCVCVRQCCYITQQHTFLLHWEYNWIEFPPLRDLSVCVLIHIWADVWEAVSCLTVSWLTTHAISLFPIRERSYDQHFVAIKDVSEWGSTGVEDDSFF